ncbi:MAG TPA: VOC family protein, partial [Nitrososphaeraceae archaeon]|nr:VOC family protein [Nitrososphaeraceae archaeon]
MRVDHVAIAVNNVDQAIKNYQKVLNSDRIEVEIVENEKVKVAMINLQDTRIELMEPTEPSSTISKYLEKHGEGIHHIAITADNIEQDLSRASASGIKL